jgi:DNA-binding transcriptional MerR regulator
VHTLRYYERAGLVVTPIARTVDRGRLTAGDAGRL